MVAGSRKGLWVPKEKANELRKGVEKMLLKDRHILFQKVPLGQSSTQNQ